jgi:hypothetical protein
MAKGRAVAIVLEAAEKSEFGGADAQARRTSGLGGTGTDRSGCG